MKLNYNVFGEGRPMIILHGLIGSLDNWQSLAKRFSGDFKVFTVDHRNHGQSPHSDDMNYDLTARDLSAFISDHKIEKPVLIGHSMGAKTVMKYTLEFPDLVHSLISVDMAPRPYPVQQDVIALWDALRSIDFEVIKSRKDVEKILMGKLNNIGMVLFLTKNVYWKEKDKLAFRFNLDTLYNNLEVITGWPDVKGHYDGRTLFIRGGKDHYITNEEPEIQTYFPNSEIITIDSGHWVHAEKPHEFYQTVMDFLN